MARGLPRPLCRGTSVLPAARGRRGPQWPRQRLAFIGPAKGLDARERLQGVAVYRLQPQRVVVLLRVAVPLDGARDVTRLTYYEQESRSDE